MSVQNGERLVTKQDLADMYQSILPYLGGMPEIVANKFSKGDIYSTEERLIGQWIDKKPLYAKTFDCGALPNGSIKYIQHNISNASSIIFMSDGFCTNGETTFTLPRIEDDTQKKCEVRVTSSEIQLLTRSGWTSGASDYNAYVTLHYTKTTDSAISIGDETDYSTTEKIVGTWIDSKPIYQKTYVLNNEEGFANNAWTYLSITEMTPIENIISLSAFQSNGTNVSFDIWYDASSHKFSVKSLRTENEYVKVFTIQYTKSS